MAHPDQIEFMLSVKDKFPERFRNARVLDIGSLDICGNNRYLFEGEEYVGIDLGEGKNVDIVCKGHEYKSEKKFNLVVSSECFEHDKYWKLTIQNAINLLRSNGLFLFSCATEGRAEHGTTKCHPEGSPFTLDYYRNLTEADIRSEIDIDGCFSEYEFRKKHCDLYFWGITPA